MSSAETITRQWDILQRIPRLPRRITVREVFDSLPTTDYQVTLRTVQRDLVSLSRKFPMTCDEEGRTQHWYW
ncbi:MAG: WYL domain-containing protein, partial [Gammaproteobacteria bacterium]|nr:WYL domain-containing protein [Gammaproteobacteria bacterium]